ncbi:MAG: hypothetical protein KatS3mg085_596 [Candidatus Dojkabacteria bacterium]|nr:MAG: hypothetical protein KatS3mg085_596 [Candidatus Dojkabacteria bacterium]
MYRVNLLKNIWNLFYAVSLSLGAYIAIESLVKFGDIKNFIGFSLALLGIFILEIYITWQRNVLINNERLDKKLIEYELIHIIHKIFLPILLYLAIVGYGYYNFYLLHMKLILFMSFVTNFLLFVNIKAFFEHKSKIEQSTNFVFDFIKFVIYWALVDVIYNFSLQLEFQKAFITFSVFLLTTIVVELFAIRTSPRHLFSFYYGVGSGVFNAILSLILVSTSELNGFEFSVILTLSFYLIISTLYHFTKKNLSYYIVFEYVLVLASVIAIILGSY